MDKFQRKDRVQVVPLSLEQCAVDFARQQEEMDIGKDADEGRAKFVNNKTLFFTYKNHLDKNGLENVFRKFFSTKIIFFRCAHENGDTSHPYPHTHVLVEWEKNVQTRNCRHFDIDGIHPNVKYVTTKTHKINCKKYLGKEDTENADLLDIKVDGFDVMNTVGQCKTVQEAICLAKKPGDIMGLKVAFETLNATKKEEEKYTVDELIRWQKELYERIEKGSQYVHVRTYIEDDVPRDQWKMVPLIKKEDLNHYDRKIIVVYNPQGGCGKTEFCRTLYLSDKKRFLVMQGCCNQRDAATIISNGIKSGWNGDTCLINLTRSVAEHNIYATLEAIRDGIITSQKYEGATHAFNIKNVVVFTNRMLRLSSCTLDRWELYIVDDINSPLEEMTIDEGFKMFESEHQLENQQYYF